MLSCPAPVFEAFAGGARSEKIRIRAIRVCVCVQQTENPLSTYGREKEGSFIMTLSRILKQHLPFLREGEEKFSDDTPFCLPLPPSLFQVWHCLLVERLRRPEKGRNRVVTHKAEIFKNSNMCGEFPYVHRRTSKAFNHTAAETAGAQLVSMPFLAGERS